MIKGTIPGKVRLAIIVVGTFLALTLALAQPLRISIDPAHLEVEIAPGDRFTSAFTLWNGTDEFLAVHLRGEDFTPQGEKGELRVGGPEAAANSLKTWLEPAYPS